MPDLRKDPIIGRWVIIAKERAKRPSDLIEEPAKRSTGFCPFCPGNEEKTPKELYAHCYPRNTGNAQEWELRIVPNKYPALVSEGEIEPKKNNIYEYMEGVGSHEVVIETPEHDSHMGLYEPSQVELVMRSYQERIYALKQNSRNCYIMIFKNHGKQAGASLDHPHSQLISLPIIPKRVKEEIDGSLTHYQKTQHCIFCDIIEHERKRTSRIVYENNRFIAIAPFASRFPFETWLLPKQHQSHFEYISPEDRQDLAESLLFVLKQLNNLLENPPYNYMLHSSPCNQPACEFPHYHWHLEITPKLTQVAGFEWGTGFYINPIPPEAAAEHLRLPSNTIAHPFTQLAH